MLLWLRRYVTWLFAAMAVAGAVATYLGLQNVRQLSDVMAKGASAAALIEGASSVTRKNALTYTIDLAWKDQNGDVRRARDVSVSRAFAHEIIADGQLIVPSTKIRFLAATPGIPPVVIADSARLSSYARRQIWFGLAGLVAGLIGAGLFGFAQFRLSDRGSPS
ncbi:MAG: hypothetical protein ACR2OV_01975 [Hyphomicrobiaceae bacterium]|jgi:hypothetical protein